MIGYTAHELNMQHRLFPTTTRLRVTEDGHRMMSEAASELETLLNQAIADGADKIQLRWMNIPDAETNPNADTGWFRLIGYRPLLQNI